VARPALEAAVTARTARDLVALAERITGKVVHVVDTPDWYRHSESAIEVPAGDSWAEDLVHEVLHWVVASDEQRIHPDSLGYGHSSDGYDGRVVTADEIAQQERAVARLQFALYAAVGCKDSVRGKDTARHALRPLSEAAMVQALERARAVGWSPLLELVRLAAGAKP
jgi:hypothetical protein